VSIHIYHYTGFLVSKSYNVKVHSEFGLFIAVSVLSFSYTLKYTSVYYFNILKYIKKD